MKTPLNALLLFSFLFFICACSSVITNPWQNFDAPIFIEPGVTIPKPNKKNYKEILTILKSSGFKVIELPAKIMAEKFYSPPVILKTDVPDFITTPHPREIYARRQFIEVRFSPTELGFSRGFESLTKKSDSSFRTDVTIIPPPTPAPIQ